MEVIRDLEFYAGSKEEKLPYAAPNFLYVASRVERDHFYRETFAPWHWHKAIELFYIESGELRYDTPNGTLLFPAGSGGMVNSNVLHTTKIQAHNEKTIQLLHIFDPQLIAGNHGSMIEQKYIMPMITAPQLEMIALYPDDPAQAGVLSRIRRAFQLTESDFGYEVNIREALSQIWLELFEICRPVLREKRSTANGTAEKIKQMMIYVYEHYPEKISVAELAGAAFLSERECYRVFQNCLHMTPVEYIKSYRLQMACQMLVDTQKPVTEIGYACISFIHNIIAILLVRIPGVYLTSLLFPTTLFPMGLATAAGSLLSVMICVVAFIIYSKVSAH